MSVTTISSVAQLEKQLHLPEQYQAQVKLLKTIGLMKKFSHGHEGIQGIDGVEYALPSYTEVTQCCREQLATLAEKVDQGFVKLLLVPFGLALAEFTEKFRVLLQAHFDRQALYYTKKNLADANEPLVLITELGPGGSLTVWPEYTNADRDGKLVYFPEEFTSNVLFSSSTPAAQGGLATKLKRLFSSLRGKTKAALLAEHGGWQMLLVEDLPNIPKLAPGKTVGSPGNERAQLDSVGIAIKQYIAPNKVAPLPSPREFLQAIQKERPYQHEHGMTPEGHISYALTYLEETNQVIDDAYGNGTLSYQLGAYFPANGMVPNAFWSRDCQQMVLHSDDVDYLDPTCGVRTAVIL